MKILYEKPGSFKVVDNEQDHDYVGWIENFTSATLVAIFESGEYEFDEETDEIIYDEDGWSLQQLAFAEDEKTIANFEEYASINDLDIICIDPHEWGGFLADNKGRSMFNALRKAYCK